MATRVYCPLSAESQPYTATLDAAWSDQSILVRAIARTTKLGSTTTNVDFPTDGDATDKNIAFRQYLSFPLTAGQTITGGQAIKAQVRCRQFDAGNNMFVTVGIRVIASDGTTIRKAVLAATRDNVEGGNAAATNRQFTATSAATNYTTVAGDRLEFVLGTGGDPDVGKSHQSRLVLGDDNGATDLPEDDTTNAGDPWIELADTLTFETTRPAIIGGGVGCDTWIIGA